MRKGLAILYIGSAISTIASTCMGIFYSSGGMARTVQNIYGQAVTLFGEGVYANDSIMKAGATKGTDIAVLFAAFMLICTITFLRNKPFVSFLQCGLLSIMLYASTSVIMGITFNRLFLLYLVQFGCTFFAFVISMTDLLRKKSFEQKVYDKRWTGTAIFLIFGGCSVLQWLSYILPVVISGRPMEIIDIYTTEPTFTIDLAIILPTTIYCGVMLLKKKRIAYQLAPVLLILLTGVAVCVIAQTIMQSYLGLVLNISQLLGLVVLFVILGIIALFSNIKLLRHTK